MTNCRETTGYSISASKWRGWLRVMTLSLGGLTRERERLATTVRTGQSIANGTVTGNHSFTFHTGEFTRDENHRTSRWAAKRYDFEKRFGFVDIGGPFFNEKITYWDNARPQNSRAGLYEYRGYSLPAASTTVDRNFGNGSYWNPVVTASDFLSLDQFGATAISRCAPTNPHAQALTSIGELYRDGLPSATGVKTIRDKDIGAEFLNYQFGIAPLLSDLKKLHKSLTESEKILNQYLRDSGRLVRRRYEQPENISSVLTTLTGATAVCTPSLVTPLYVGTSGSAVRNRLVTTTSKRWFSGGFTYHAELPSGRLNSMAQGIREYNHLFGLLPTPAVLWNLTPWSWAADWITNMGDVLNNISMYQSDGLVLTYGYVMEHKTITREYHTFGYSLGSTGPVNVMNRFTSEVKSRRKATPFGFGLSLESFSNRQWAILAALGISKGRAVAF